MGTERQEGCGYTHIELCVRRGAEPIEGAYQDDTGRGAPFWGWLELISALETARAGDLSDRSKGAGFEGGTEVAHPAEGERGARATPAPEGEQ
jgi:hypothetical protein